MANFFTENTGPSGNGGGGADGGDDEGSGDYGHGDVNYTILQNDVSLVLDVFCYLSSSD